MYGHVITIFSTVDRFTLTFGLRSCALGTLVELRYKQQIWESMTFLDSAAHAVDSRFQVWIPVFVNGTRILDSHRWWDFGVPTIFPDSGIRSP